MQEERMRILDMIASGKITAQEGATLLEAINSGARKETPWPHLEWPHHHQHHWGGPQGEWGEKSRLLRIRVTDNKSDKPVVNISLPVAMLKWSEKMGKMGKAFSKKFKNIFIDVENIDEIAEGKIAEALDDKSDKKVEVWVE